jgi:hypothetical protein
MLAFTAGLTRNPTTAGLSQAFACDSARRSGTAPLLAAHAAGARAFG